VVILRRYWWLILVIVALSVLAAAAATLIATTTYTARASLILASNDRSPEQDAVLVQGYVAYFNDPPYQSQLLAHPEVGEGVTFEARAAAASPIFIVDATATEVEKAKSAVAAAASAFSQDVNTARRQRNESAIADLEEQIDTILITGDDSQFAVMQVTQLRDRISQLQADQANMLQELQLDAGVTQNSSSAFTNILLGLLGGLLLGILAAVATGGISGSSRAVSLGPDDS
jgi:hypothetical protein